MTLRVSTHIDTHLCGERAKIHINKNGCKPNTGNTSMQASDKTTEKEETRWLFYSSTWIQREGKKIEHKHWWTQNVLELHHQNIVKDPLFWSPLLKYSQVVSSISKNKGLSTTAPAGKKRKNTLHHKATSPCQDHYYSSISPDIFRCFLLPKTAFCRCGCKVTIPAKSSLLLLHKAKQGPMEKLSSVLPSPFSIQEYKIYIIKLY